jgi:hypothetical protein
MRGIAEMLTTICGRAKNCPDNRWCILASPSYRRSEEVQFCCPTFGGYVETVFIEANTNTIEKVEFKKKELTVCMEDLERYLDI